MCACNYDRKNFQNFLFPSLKLKTFSFLKYLFIFLHFVVGYFHCQIKIFFLLKFLNWYSNFWLDYHRNLQIEFFSFQAMYICLNCQKLIIFWRKKSFFGSNWLKTLCILQQIVNLTIFVWLGVSVKLVVKLSFQVGINHLSTSSFRLSDLLELVCSF